MDCFKKIWSFDIGSLFAIISAVCIAVYESLIKQITTDLRLGTFLAIKNILQVLISLIFIFVTKNIFIPTERSEMKVLALRSTSSSLLAVTAAICYMYLNVFDAFAFFYSGCLIFGIIIALLYFKERIGVFKIFTIILLLIGLIFVSQPTFLFGHSAKIDTNYAIGIAAVVTCGVCQSVSSMSVKMMEETPTHLIILYSGLCGIIFAIISYSIDNSENIVPTYDQMIEMLIQIVIYIVYLFTQINALKKIQFIKFQIFSLFDLPIAFLIDYFWFHTGLNVFRWTGFACIIVALFANAVYECCTQSVEDYEPIDEKKNDHENNGIRDE